MFKHTGFIFSRLLIKHKEYFIQHYNPQYMVPTYVVTTAGSPSGMAATARATAI